MKKMLITFALAFVAVLLAALALAPTQISFVSHQVVAAPPHEVYDQLRLFNRYPQWSVWKEQDPEQRHILTGRDGEVGARYAWEGVREKGKGYQELIALQPNQKVAIRCYIQEPFQSQPAFTYQLKPTTDGHTTVEQHFSVNLGRPFNIIAIIIGLRGKMEANNKRSLELLSQSLTQTTKHSTNTYMFETVAR